MKTIAIEGIDGSGKALQSELLQERWARAGKSVRSLSFPCYDTFFGAEVGRYLRGEGVRADEVDSRSMCLWYALDRFDAMRGHEQWTEDILLLNRYTLSNAVYQSVRAIDREIAENWDWVQKLEHGRLGLPRPDLYLILDVAPDDAQRNVDSKGVREYVDGRDVYESQHGLLTRARKRYLDIARREPSMAVIRCDDQKIGLRPADEIAQDVWRVIKEKGFA